MKRGREALSYYPNSFGRVILRSSDDSILAMVTISRKNAQQRRMRAWLIV